MVVLVSIQQKVYRYGIVDCKTNFQMNIVGPTSGNVLFLARTEFTIVAIVEIRNDKPNGEIGYQLLVRRYQFMNPTTGQSGNANISL